METNVIWRNARAAVIELDDGGYFTCADTWEIFVNDEPAGTTNTVETYVDGLTPGKRNLVRFVCGERELSVGVTTPAEPFTINVRDCGAKGDAEHDDTTNIQAAIMACPKGGRVLIPAGSYRIKSLFLKSNINIELAEGAVLLARHDRAALAYIPGTVTGNEGAGYAGTDMLPLGRWEGESFSTYCSTFTGLSVHDVCIYGRGAIDGQTIDVKAKLASEDNTITIPTLEATIGDNKLNGALTLTPDFQPNGDLAFNLLDLGHHRYRNQRFNRRLLLESERRGDVSDHQKLRRCRRCQRHERLCFHPPAPPPDQSVPSHTAGAPGRET